MTKYVYEMLISGKREFQLTEGRVMLTVPQSELNGGTILELAGAIAYVESWAHELSTWRTSTQDLSSFSPEDVFSNILGIETGKKAILAGCDFNDSMTQEINTVLKELGAFVGTERTKKVLASILARSDATDKSGKWVQLGDGIFSYPKLLRRNFGYKVWLVDPDNPDDPKGNVSIPTAYNPDRYEKYFDKFTYTMLLPVISEGGIPITGFTLKDMPELTRQIREEWLAKEENKGMATWP
jgi:hypothetical protein